MTPSDEEYVHFEECLTRLNHAWRIICELEHADSNSLVWIAAYQMAIIEYAKPYKESRGTNKWRYIIPTPELDDTNRLLHEKLLSLRDTFLAHSDLTIKDAKVSVVSIAGNPKPQIILNTEPLMPPLAEVKALIESTLEILYKEIPKQEANVVQSHHYSE